MISVFCTFLREYSKVNLTNITEVVSNANFSYKFKLYNLMSQYCSFRCPKFKQVFILIFFIYIFEAYENER
jgi:hypothetical protein